jgi:peptidoglycan/LPS O-acetylase OafA/YrhL
MIRIDLPSWARLRPPPPKPPTDHEINRPALPALTSLRFFAALDVLVGHYGFPDSAPFSLIRNSGYECVIFFFVLSGFILAYVYGGPVARASANIRALAFWRARYARIAPSYCLALVIALPLFAYGALVTKITPFAQFVEGIVLTPLFLQGWTRDTYLVWNAPAWSLSTEALFYFIFPVVSIVLARVRLATALILGLALLALLFCLVVTLRNLPANGWEFARHHPLLHVPEFIFGIVVGRLFLFGRRFSAAAHWVLFTIAALAVTSIFALRGILPDFTHNNSVLTLAFSALIFGAAGLPARAPFLTSSLLVALGEASYALYILHVPLLWWWTQFTSRTGLHLPIAWHFSFYLALSITASLLTWRLWEIPARRRLLRLGASKRTLPSTSAASAS